MQLPTQQSSDGDILHNRDVVLCQAELAPAGETKRLAAWNMRL